MIPPAIKNKIESVVNVFETGSVVGKYGSLVKIKDYSDPESHSNIVQITYGRSQTTEFGNLGSLIKMYVDANGLYSQQLKPYLNRVGKKPSLSTDKSFCKMLIDAGKNDPVMKNCQDEFFDSFYYLPAYGWFNQMGFILPLSMLVIYDSFVHSGGILSFLRERFPEKPPVKGGEEKRWISEYVDVRHEWLKNHTKKVLRETIYRTQCFKNQINTGNWDLSQPVNANGIVIL
jgi:chitosanase